MEDSAEPVKVFVRLRPEDEGVILTPRSVGSPTSNHRKNSITSLASTISTVTAVSTQRHKCVSMVDANTVRLSPPDGALGNRRTVTAVDDKVFTFDAVFPEDSTQEDVYSCVSSLVRATVKGYNTTIFAYGCTGSGKSFTMTGTNERPGIIPRAVSEIFSIIERTAVQEHDVFFMVRMSYVELYNNNFRNLLDFHGTAAADGAHHGSGSSSARSNLEDSGQTDLSLLSLSDDMSRPNHKDKIEVRESASAGVFLAGPNLRLSVTSAHEAFQLINKGNKVRATGYTQCNDLSSRSHAILTIHVESRLSPGVEAASGDSTPPSPRSETRSPGELGAAPAELRLGKMHLVDLAGSERLAMSHAEGETLLETQNINLSLTALGNVLSALSRNAQLMTHQNSKVVVGGTERSLSPGRKNLKHPVSLAPVPYRDSKLTHLLKDSLGGNSKTIMITNIRGISDYYQQTAISLMYASRAKKVRNRSVLNRNIVGDTGIHAVTLEIDRLRTRLEERSAEFERLRMLQMHEAEENLALKAKFQSLQAANDLEKKQLEAQMKRVIHSQAGQLVSQKQKITHLQQSLQGELAISHNKIAEQEKEIKWLKRALDESTEAASHQPTDQLERMQRVADAWQAQAKSTQKELTAALATVDSLRAQNAELSTELSAARNDVQSVRDELTAASTEQQRLSSTLSKALKDCDQLTKINEELQLRHQQVSGGNKDLESRLLASQDELASGKDEMTALKKRIVELDRDRRELRHKLDSTVQDLEKRATSHLESAVQKLAAKDEEIKLLTERLRAAEQTAEQMRLLRQDIELKQQRSESAANKRAEALSTELKQKLLEAQQLRASFDSEMQQIQIKFEKQLQDERQSRKASEEKLKEDHAKAMKDQANAMQQSHKEEIENLRASADGRIKRTEEFLKRQIDSEIDGGIKSLNLKHALEISEMQDTFRLRLENELNQERFRGETALQQAIQEAEEASAAAMREVESRHAHEISKLRLEFSVMKEKLSAHHQEELREALRIEKEVLSVEKNKELHELIVHHRQQSEQQQAAFSQERDQIIARMTRDHERKLRELEIEVTNRLESQTSLKLEEVTRETKAKYQAQLKSAIASHKAKLDEKLKERFDQAAKEEEALRRKTKELEEFWEDNRRQEIERAVQDQTDLLKAEHKLAMEELLQGAVAQRDEHWKKIHEREKRDTEFRYNEELRTLQESLEKKHEAAMQALQFELKAAHAQSLQREIDELENISRQTEFAHREELASLNQKHLNELAAAVRDAKDAAKRELRDSLDSKSKESTEECSRLLKEQEARLQREFDQQIQKLQSLHVLELEDSRMQSKRDLEVSLGRAKQEWKEDHRGLMLEAQQNHRAELQSALDAQRVKLEERYKGLLSDRDDVISQLRGEIVSLVQSNNDTLSKSLLEQQSSLIERHRQEMLQQRDEQAASEEKYEKLITSMTQEHEAALNSQRRHLEQAHQVAMDACASEFNALQQKYSDFVKESSLSRQRDELVAQKLQRDQFDELLKTSLAERDEFHRQAALRAQESFENEKARLVSVHERHMAALKAENAREIETLQLAMKSSEQRWRAQSLHDAEQRECRHREELAQLSSELALKHSRAITDLKSVERAALDTKMMELLQELETAKGAQVETSLLLAKQRADFEREKFEAASSAQRNMEALENRHRREVADLEIRLQDERDNALSTQVNEFESRVKLLEESHQRSLADALDSERRRLNETWEIELSHARNEFRVQSEAQQAAYNDLVEEKRRTAISVRAEREQLQTGFQSQLSKLEAELLQKHQSDLEQLSARLESKHLENLSEALELERRLCDGKIAALKNEFVQMEKTHSVEKSNLLDRAELEKQELAAQWQRTQEFQRNQHATELSEAESKFRAELASALAVSAEEHLAKLELLRVTHQRELSEQLNEKELQLSEKWSKVISRIRAESNQQLEELGNRHRASVAVTGESHQQFIDELQDHIKRLESSRDELCESHASRQREMVLKLEEERSRCTDEVERIKTELSSMRRQYESQIAALSEQHLVKVGSLQENHLEQIKELQAAANSRYSECTEKFRMEFVALEESHAATVALLRETSSQQLQEADAQHRAELDSILQEMDQLREALSKATDEHCAQVAAQESRYLSVQTAYEEDKIKWNEDLDGLARQVIDAEAEVDVYKSSLERAQEECRLQIERLIAEGQMQQLAAKEALSAIQEECHELRNELQRAETERSRLQELCAQLNAEIDSAREEAQGHSMLALEFSKQVTELGDSAADYRAQLAEAVRKYSSAVSNCDELKHRIGELEATLQAMQTQFKDTLAAALAAKEEEVRRNYFDAFQLQMGSLKEIIESQGRNQQRSLPQFAELHKKFLDMVDDLPGFLKDTLSSQTSTSSPSADASTSAETPTVSVTNTGTNTMRSVPPISVLTQAEMELKGRGSSRSFALGFQPVSTSQSQAVANPPPMLTRSLSLSPMSSRRGGAASSTPIDQLIACLQEGDVQGVRTVVRSVSGDDLRSDYWRQACKTIMPLHRAMKGLHFHGNDKLLYQTVEALLQLGANIHATDRFGNTVLHTAIIMCTSRGVVPIIKLLLHKGADVRARNKDGDMPIHLECKRLRSASPEVLTHLLNASADPNPCTRSVDSTCLANDVVSKKSPLASFDQSASNNSTSCWVGPGPQDNASTVCREYSCLDLILIAAEQSKSAPESTDEEHVSSDGEDEKFDIGSSGPLDQQDENQLGKSAVRGVWVRAAETLVKAGCRWNDIWRDSVQGNSELHLLLASYPPPVDDAHAYRGLLNSCLAGAGMSCGLENGAGVSALHLFCERLARLRFSNHPGCLKIVKCLLTQHRGSSDDDLLKSLEKRTWKGSSLSDIPHSSSSCLSACMESLKEKMVALRSSTRLARSSSSPLQRSDRHVVDGSNPLQRAHLNIDLLMMNHSLSSSSSLSPSWGDSLPLSGVALGNDERQKIAKSSPHRADVVPSSPIGIAGGGGRRVLARSHQDNSAESEGAVTGLSKPLSRLDLSMSMNDDDFDSDD